jgi:protein-S-isoprenylcysteine O-methyltransferase Ste14
MNRSAVALVPPPVWFGAAFALGAGVHVVAPLRLPLVPWFPAAAGILLAIAGWLALSAVWVLRRAGAGIRPDMPAAAFVTHGPYRYTRNPMYLSLVLLYVGVSLISGFAWPLLSLPIAVRVVQAHTIRAEEQHLEERFGEDYICYARRVRRWL